MSKYENKTGLELAIDAIIAANPEAKVIIDNNPDKYNYVFSDSEETGKRNILIECTDSAPMVTSPDHFFNFELLRPASNDRVISAELTGTIKEAIDATDGDVDQISEIIADYLELPRDQLHSFAHKAVVLETGENAMFFEFKLGHETHSVVDETFEFGEMENDPNAETSGVYLVLGKLTVAEVYPNRDVQLG